MSLTKDDVLKVFDDWRRKLPVGAFSHSDGVAFVRKIEALASLDALTPRPEASAWQPIALAPRDGTVIDVWLGDANEDEVQFYCTPGTRRSAAWSWKGDKFRPFGGLTWMQTTFVQPTHWQPLPSRPTEAGQ